MKKKAVMKVATWVVTKVLLTDGCSAEKKAGPRVVKRAVCLAVMMAVYLALKMAGLRVA